MGVDSGLPDFRGPEGFWRAYPALRGYSFSDMANPEWFDVNPNRAWGFYGHRLNLYRTTLPHDGFDILLKWCANRSHFVYTSNVDGAFQKAGFESERIVECHGSIHHLQYVDEANGTDIWSAEGVTVTVDEQTVLAADPLPQRDGHLLRPNILMFGDWGWIGTRSNRQQRRLQSWMDGLEAMERCVVVEMGAGKVIPTIRVMGEQFQRAGATLIRINPRDFDGPAGTISVATGAKDGLQAIDRMIAKET